jgi:hypothetical protein
MASGLARTAPENPEKSRQTRLTAVNFHESAPDAHLRLDEGDIDGRGADKKRFAPTATLTDAALADSTPHHQTIFHYFDDNMLARIAAEYAKGRRLFIQTTDLDGAARPLENRRRRNERPSRRASSHPCHFRPFHQFSPEIPCIALSFRPRRRTPESHMKRPKSRRTSRLPH